MRNFGEFQLHHVHVIKNVQKKMQHGQKLLYFKTAIQLPRIVLINTNFILKCHRGRIHLYCKLRLQDLRSSNEMFLKIKEYEIFRILFLYEPEHKVKFSNLHQCTFNLSEAIVSLVLTINKTWKVNQVVSTSFTKLKSNETLKEQCTGESRSKTPETFLC